MPPVDPPPFAAVPVISARELHARLERGDDLTVIDVREPWELLRASLDGAQPIPLAYIPASAPTLEREREYVIMCHHGMRSEMATQWLRQQGFPTVWNLAGGIDAWSREVDPSVPRY